MRQRTADNAFNYLERRLDQVLFWRLGIKPAGERCITTLAKLWFVFLADQFGIRGRDFCFERLLAVFVGGFKADEVVERYPEVRVIFNRDWAHGGPMQSLGLAPLGAGCDTYVCYSDVVFRRPAVARLSAAGGDAVFAVDSRWRDRYEGRGRGDLDDAEFLGFF